MASTLPSLIPDHTQSLFRSCLSCALRSALACTIIGVVSIYLPSDIQDYLKFPAFSYVIAVLIVSDATLGHTIQSAILSIYATILGLSPAMLAVYLIRPAGISIITATAAVGISSFVVVFSDISEGLITKRIALGQIVLVYVAGFNSKVTDGISAKLHLAPVTASTVLGVVAAVVALIVPYPRLACSELRKKSKMYTGMAMARLRLLVNALCADDKSGTVGFISQAKSIGRTSNKLLHSILLLEGIEQWERPSIKFLQPYKKAQSNELEEKEIQLKGMELALCSSSTLITGKIFEDQIHLKDQILNLQNQIITKALKDNICEDTFDKSFLSLQNTPKNFNELPPFFFLFCMKILANKNPNPEQGCSSSIKAKGATQGIWKMNLNTKKFIAALKCSLTLGLAVFLGLLYSREAGYWAGLTVSTTFTPFGQSTFKLANSRAHGAAIGSIYGVLGTLISQNLMEIRLLALVPWIIFTSFLQRSKMYGQAGAISAVLSAMIIMGRRNYGSPVLFTIDRLVETYIGLCCTIFFEVLFQPTRASSVARSKLLESFKVINECITSVTSLVSLREKEKKLKQVVKELKKYSREAEIEPNFWFLPFSGTCYDKLHGSLSKVDECMFFIVRALDALMHESHTIGESVKVELDHFKEICSTTLKCYEEIIQVKSLQKLEKELKNKIAVDDVELGWKESSVVAGEGESEKIVGAFLRRSKMIVESIDEDLGGEVRTKLVLCFAAIGFCIGNLMRELNEIEKGVHELMQWENPNSYISLYEISCKIRELSNC